MPAPPLNRTTSAVSVPLPRFNPARIRSYLFRLPLFTRLVFLAVFVLWLLELQTVWNVIQWGALIPKDVNLGSLYRLNTYPVIHQGFIHMFIDTLCLVPLLERFEAEWGTLNSLALFLGRTSRHARFTHMALTRCSFQYNTGWLVHCGGSIHPS